MKCLRVNQNGDIDIINYLSGDFMIGRLENKTILKGVGEYVLVEEVDTEEQRRYIVYGWLGFDVLRFNLFNFAFENPSGDAMVVCIENGVLVDVDREEFINMYQSEDNLEEYLIRDELEELFGDRDTGYEYDDFVVRSDDEN